MEAIFWLLLVGGVGVVWLTSLRARELATHLAREHCARRQLQFLDDTVALASLRPALAHGRLLIRRRYQFEFSEHGDLRRAGYVDLLGLTLENLQLEPYEIVH